jgi:hypothetical protein
MTISGPILSARIQWRSRRTLFDKAGTLTGADPTRASFKQAGPLRGAMGALDGAYC